MGSRINAAGHSAEDNQSAGSQVPGLALGHAVPIGGRMACADYGNPWLINYFSVALEVKNEWRVADFQQPAGEIWHDPER